MPIFCHTDSRRLIKPTARGIFFARPFIRAVSVSTVLWTGLQRAHSFTFSFPGRTTITTTTTTATTVIPTATTSATAIATASIPLATSPLGRARGRIRNSAHRASPYHLHRSTAVAMTTSSISSGSSNFMFDLTPEMWEEYTVLMDDIMIRDRVVKKAKPQSLPPVHEFLLDRAVQDISSLVLGTGKSSHENSTLDHQEQLRQKSRRQYDAFIRDEKGFTKHQAEYLQRCLSYMGDWCAKKQLTVPALIAWIKMRQIGFVPRENTVSTFLFVFSLQPEDSKFQAALTDVATLHDLYYPPNEKTVFLRIKSLVASGDAAEAESLLQAIPDVQKLRTFTPILSYYCQHNDVSHALRIFRRMRESPGVYLDAETYVMLISTIASRGFFATDHSLNLAPDQLMIEAGFPVTGPALFDALASEMAQDLLEFNLTAGVSLYESLRTAMGNADETLAPSNTIPAISCSNPASISSSSTFLGRVTIDPSTSTCQATGAKLRLFSLTQDQRIKVRQTLLEMASSQHEEFAARMVQQDKKRKQSTTGDYALEQLSVFADWVAEQNFTAIIDGPNVAYFGHPVLHYSQVQRMVKHLESLGERPLVVMPYKYCQSSFYVASINQEQTLDKRDLQIIDDLKEKGQLYMVPQWCLDDYYWMIASVVAHFTDEALSDTSLPGLRPLLITNDQMRDHKLTLLEPRLFRRWTSCHIVRYSFGQIEQDEWTDDRKVLLESADSFSREIQGNQIPCGLTVWHIPIAEWNEETPNDRFCIAIGK